MARLSSWLVVVAAAALCVASIPAGLAASSSRRVEKVSSVNVRFADLVQLRQAQTVVQKQAAQVADAGVSRIAGLNNADFFALVANVRPDMRLQKAQQQLAAAQQQEDLDRSVVRPAARFRRVRRAVRRVGRGVGRVVGRVVRGVGRVIGGGVRRIVKRAKKVVKYVGPIIKQIVINYALTAIPVAGQIYAAYQVFRTIDDPKKAILTIAKQYLPGVIPPEVTEWVDKAKKLKTEFNTYKQILRDPKAALRQYGRELVDQIVAEFDMTEVENAIARYQEVEEQARLYIAIAKDPKAAIRAHGQVVLRDFFYEHAGEHIERAQAVVQQFKDGKRQFKDMVAAEKARAETIFTGILAVVQDPKGVLNAVVDDSLGSVLRAVDNWRDNALRDLRDEFERKTSLTVLAIATERLADEADKIEGDIGQRLHLLAEGLATDVKSAWNNNGISQLIVRGKDVKADARAVATCARQNNWKCVGQRLLKMAETVASVHGA